MSKELFFEYREMEGETIEAINEMQEQPIALPKTATITVDIETLPSAHRPNVDGLSEEEATEAIADWHKEGLNPFKGRVLCIGLKVNDAPAFIIIAESEEETMQQFNQLLAKFKNVKWVGHNAQAFDVPFLAARVHKYQLKYLFDHLPRKKYGAFPSLHDTMLKAQVEQYRFGMRVSLDTLCKFYGIESPKQDGDSGAAISDMYENGELERIAKYCIRDVEQTHKVYKAQTWVKEVPFK